MSLTGYNPYIYTNNFKNGEHHHMVLSISGTIHTLYLDGVKVAQNNSAGNFLSSYSTITNTTIGARKTFTNAFKGTIDDVRVYNYALSSNNISSLYLDRNLIVYYPFDTSLNNSIPNYATLTYDASFIGQSSITNNELVLQNSAISTASQYVRSNPINININANTGLTISCWINTNGISNQIQRIFDIPLYDGIKGLSVDISGTNQISSQWITPPPYYLFYRFDTSLNNMSPDNFYGYKKGGTFYGTATISNSTKKYGTGSLKLTSKSDYFTLQNVTTNNTNAITISWWGNYSTYDPANTGGAYGIFFSLFGLTPYIVRTEPWAAMGYNIYSILLGSNGWGVNVAIMPINTWNHYAFVISNTTVTFYVNTQIPGQPWGVVSGPDVANINFNNNIIGDSSYTFPGYIDDFRIFNYALTSTEINEVYNGNL